MNKFLKRTGLVAIVILVLIGIVGLVIWDMGLLQQRRQPLDIVTPAPINMPADSPLDDVGDRHDDTRDWIQERLDNHVIPPRPEYPPPDEPP